MDIIYLDIVLLIILCILTTFMCGYGFYCLYRLVRTMQMQILLRPTRVLFSARKEGQNHEELRTVVAYKNPFTGDYCVHKSRAPSRGYVNSLQQSPDSGLSDEYEPLTLDPGMPEPMPLQPPRVREDVNMGQSTDLTKTCSMAAHGDNRVDKTWNWNYKEYQI